MCITRAGRVVTVADGRARVEFFDGRSLEDVDVTMVKASSGSYVEVYGNLALSKLSPAEARSRKKAWDEVMRGEASR